VSYYEYHFLYVAGIEHVESKSIQNTGLIKLFFHPGTDMNQALAQVIASVERSKAFMPPGTVNPFVMRFDAGSVAVGILVDEATVEIENVNTHLEQGEPPRVAAFKAASQTVMPRFLSMLAVLAVFVPALFMIGVARDCRPRPRFGFA
jgi:multidrug efflux pump subunit AcrB